MLEKIISFSVKNKLIVFLFTFTVFAFGMYSILHIPVGAVPDITNNQVQVITTSGNLSTQEIEQFITAPVEMEMANLPGVKEIRSISKFGISLVTVVLDENLGTYLPRQLINEKIKLAVANIPEEYGTPEMGPITTGLGEIFQYTLSIKPGYEDQFTAMDLRTIQDWNIRRRLSGINGVVEINSWGGFLKQYEVAIKPELLKSYNITLIDVYNALQANNAVAGAGYIEKNNESYFIRGDGQVKSIQDIENIVIKSNGASPIFVKNVADIKYGYANRFGAITSNGKGETVLGQVMMLKNANSKLVINQVKERIKEIQSGLPEGIEINPILDRSELIGKTTSTVAENLILGAIIVMFAVFLILGNLRSALVIASMIPLSLSFTLSMMYVFGVDANLMSLGALDFGIIIDGAVIIVEFIMLKLMKMKDEINSASGDARSEIMDKNARIGASRMMKSAIFGQVIILIIFIPILSLTGVEGKMFRPMALAFCFAIIGAMIMGLTWLPAASAVFLKPGKDKVNKLTLWIMNVANRTYEPAIKWAFQHKKTVITMAVASLIIVGTLFLNMGGEFVPTLDEGDFVIQPVLKTGTSLSKTVETTTNMESILIKNFPNEVDQVVSRIGAAEVPTDPMSMEEIDMIVRLKPKSEWKAAKNKDELEEKFKEKLSVIPGIEYEFTQPIEMRFNELITGVRSDIAIKIFGDDLDYINEKATEIKNIVEKIPGASDVIIEKTTGLPQIKVKYRRDRLAYYGVSVATLNTYLQSAFGGQMAGVVFEGEKRFDLVLRFDSKDRVDINNIMNLMVQVDGGAQVPFAELADISYTNGPAKISRENTRRRVVVSINVRNRDLQSLVEDIKMAINKNVKLNADTYIKYGGQFENLENATTRLIIVVPIALALIFIFLHFAFRSLRDAIMIFSAIPLATVGGIVLLWLRGMPFSVSAGVGFIALFGIAVLNGIVLIEHLKELDVKNFNCACEMIIHGAKHRLRPVMLTAGAAALGFLPMAISSGAGAEVQRPLATVVIGGLITSTLLTMIVLPLLYEFLYNIKSVKFFPFKVIRRTTCAIALMMVLPAAGLFSQSKELTLDELINTALAKNQKLQSLEIKIKSKEISNKSSYLFDKTNISYGYDQANYADNSYPLHTIGIGQNFAYPGYYSANKQAGSFEIQMAASEYKIQKNNLIRDICSIFYEQINNIYKNKMYTRIDSMYSVILRNTEYKKKIGDADNLELLNIKAKKQKSELNLKANSIDIQIAYNKLKQLTDINEDFRIAENNVNLEYDTRYIDTNANAEYLKFQNDYYKSLIDIERYKNYPDLSIQYNLSTNTQAENRIYNGIELGIAIPLFNTGQANKVEAAKFAFESQQLLSDYELKQLKARNNELSSELLKYKELINYYNSTGKALKDEIERTAITLYNIGEINFFEFVQTYENALQIEENQINSITKYQQLLTEIYYLNK